MRDLRWVSLDKRRPAVILTRPHMLGLLRRWTVAPITSTVRQIPTEVAVGRANGLARDCVISCDNVQTVLATEQVHELIGHLDLRQELALRQALLVAYDLDGLPGLHPTA